MYYMDAAISVVDEEYSIVHAYIFCFFYMVQTAATGGFLPLFSIFRNLI